MKRPSSIRSADCGPGLACPPSPGWGLFLRCCEVMTSDNSLPLILRRLDEIERKLDHMLEELRTLNTTPPPSAIRCAGAIFQRRTEERS